MKKITLLAALLATSYFANAQVGIGTPDPATSAELEIVSKLGDKGILIPRVELTEQKKFEPIKGSKQESLLVFNKTAATEMPKGFYYWFNDKWNRIIGKEELNTVIEDLGGDITNITNKLEGDVKNLQAVINYILPSNPDNKDKDGNPIVKEDHSTIVYNPIDGKMYYVTYKAGKYTTQEIDILKMVQGVETNTFFKEVKDSNGKVTGYIYFNESTIVKAIGDETDPSKIQDIIDGLSETTPGAVKIDVKATVVNNIQEIFNSSSTVVKPGTTNEYYTVEELIQNISKNVQGNVIYTEVKDPSDPTKTVWQLQYFDKSTNTYKKVDLNHLVAEVETKTNILRAEATDTGVLSSYDAVVAPIVKDVKKGEIFYKYNNEDKKEQFINMTSDILSSINNNEDIQNAITNVLNKGGNVYFGKLKDTDTEEVFYKIELENGIETRKKIDLPASFLTDIINKYKDVIKLALGDNITNEGDIIFTGNIIGGKKVYLAKGSVKTIANSARTQGVELVKATDKLAIGTIISIKLLKDNNLITSTVRDVVVSGTKIDFNIGFGDIYTVLPQDTYEVIVEYTLK
ncbi:hypothetical protein [Myroides injenensis]|uniref:hypothetical protein n=1 Tax=Myroides injenensis TaxID=1183151 RepID=UPI000289F322|nr:hypothetical protein [Myroides injenensis]